MVEPLIEPRLLKRLRVAELKELLEQRGLSTEGIQKELVARLEECRAAEEAAEEGGGGEPAVGTPAAEGEDAPAVEPPIDEAPADEETPADAADAQAEEAPADDPADAEPESLEKGEPAPTDGGDPGEAGAEPDAADADGTASESADLPPAAPKMPVVSSQKLDRARNRLAQNRQDLDAWETIVADAQTRGVPEGRSLFEEVLAAHPTASRVWRAYAEAEIAGDTGGNRDDEAVKAIFSRCLLSCPSALLWRSYTRYMEKTNDAGTEEGVQAIKAAFEYTVDTVGEDLESGPLWLDYVVFLKSADPTHACPEAKPEQAESARMQEVRRAYQRAVSVPTNSIDALYREYDAFEHGVSAALAKPLLAEVKPGVDVARAALKERKRLHDQCIVGGLAGPPGTSKDEKSPDGQARAWRAMINWERSNPQKLTPDAEAGETAHPQLVTRVALAYDQALMSLWNFPDIWLEFAAWHEGNDHEEAKAVLQRAREALPGCPLVHFAAADLDEARGDATAASAVYESVLDEYEVKCAADAEAANVDGADDFKFDHPPMDDATLLVSIEYMRCARRMRGRDEARKSFMRVRKAPGKRWEAFAAAALLEWRYDKNDKVARNVFELGLKSFISQPQYVARYAEFLVGCNDVGNARVLFERATAAAGEATAAAAGLGGTDKAGKASVEKVFWDMFVDFEHTHGTMDTMKGVETRRREAVAGPDAVDGAPEIITALLGRHSIFDLRPVSEEHMRHFARIGVAVPEPAPAGSARPGAPAPPPPRLPPPPAGKPKGPKGPKLSGPAPNMAPLPPPDPMVTGAVNPRFAHLPRELGSFASRLPAMNAAVNLSLVDSVMDALINADVTPEGGTAIVDAFNAGLGGGGGGTKRKAGDAGVGGKGPARGAPLTAASQRPPERDVFRMRQAIRPRTDQAEFS
jgi:cleavage stimulation factor subunit 3